MEDAYVIGIRLALDNGVSAGVAAIRDELKALDGAIANTTTSLRQLQALAAQTGTASLIPPARQPPPATPPPTSADTTALPSPALSVQAPTGDTLSRPPAPLPQSVTTPGATTPSAQSSAPSAGPAPTPLRIEADITGAPQTSFAPPLPTPVSPAQPLAADSASTQAPRGMAETSAPAKAPTISREPATGLPRATSPKMVAEPAAPTKGLDVPAQSSTAPSSSSLALPESQPAARHVAPPRVVGPRDQTQSGQLTAPPSQHAIAPQTQSPSAAPTTGDVYLDGMRLGHWIASNLARQTNRPPSGGTSFDPRLGISWPGAQQSGD